ncbi:aminomethyltransferase [Halorhodospira halochloris]|uniref:Aminomethyltransferase n=1 Tax=Halorhodospira halochloris TaxID=1052 RepID=A0A0X8X6X4_HALHR|nr:glycine cleavage system aminomethyltransferase GcvT [Halorhodospira halochloris]MBK1650797.1 glycine cleavage system protein T [Halorhodospira halochloris]MCG5547150.1 glycine cleavage system aminomethyltransferase GcvT [Halorhodospira halochloris]BAU56705.2 aminomethyltransferase [Halorhodospira halochloris]
MSQRTPLYDIHQANGARMVDYHGWALPLHYGSQLNEHHAVRDKAGLFDVSHMVITDLSGGARSLLRRLLANDVAKLDGKQGKALYSCLLNEQGGVIDDLIVYHCGSDSYRIISNAATRERVMEILQSEAARESVEVRPRDELALIAIQGPQAATAVEAIFGEEAQGVLELKLFASANLGDYFFGRTGYTGEDGFEIALPAADASQLWQSLIEQGAQPCGLGARDSLRLEAGLNLNGNEMDERTSPLEAGLAWTVAWEPTDRDFIGRTALEQQRQSGPAMKQVGLVVEGRAPARSGYEVRTDAGAGIVTSGGHAPTVGGPIALAKVPSTTTAEQATVIIRGREVGARIVEPVFVRNGKVLV